MLRSRLLKDMRNTKVIVQVWALGMIGKLFTGPWMTKFYSSLHSNLEMVIFYFSTTPTQS